jgi:hypothetical protein
VSPELIGALVIALTGLLSGLTGVLSKRSKDRSEELEQMRKDYAFSRTQLRLADQWIFAIVRVCDQNGIQIPPPPDGLQTSTPEVRRDRDDATTRPAAGTA